jgi:hypothetical protein
MASADSDSSPPRSPFLRCFPCPDDRSEPVGSAKRYGTACPRCPFSLNPPVPGTRILSWTSDFCESGGCATAPSPATTVTPERRTAAARTPLPANSFLRPRAGDLGWNPSSRLFVEYQSELDAPERQPQGNKEDRVSAHRKADLQADQGRGRSEAYLLSDPPEPGRGLPADSIQELGDGSMSQIAETRRLLSAEQRSNHRIRFRPGRFLDNPPGRD